MNDTLRETARPAKPQAESFTYEGGQVAVNVLGVEFKQGVPTEVPAELVPRIAELTEFKRSTKSTSKGVK